MTRKADTKQIDAIVAELELSREQRQLLHRRITRQNLTYKEIREEAMEVRKDFPGKRDHRHD
jgi:hypothetical protein